MPIKFVKHRDFSYYWEICWCSSNMIDLSNVRNKCWMNEWSITWLACLNTFPLKDEYDTLASIYLILHNFLLAIGHSNGDHSRCLDHTTPVTFRKFLQLCTYWRLFLALKIYFSPQEFFQWPLLYLIRALPILDLSCLLGFICQNLTSKNSTHHTRVNLYGPTWEAKLITVRGTWWTKG